MSHADHKSAWARFIVDHPVLRARVTTFRVAFFGLLAMDLWLLMLVHAPRHATAGFNVGHIPLLQGILPDPSVSIVSAGYLIGGFLAARIAVGLAVRLSTVVLTVIYSALYFWSQIDSYQHHYLICLILLLSCFVRFDELPGLDREQVAPRTESDEREPQMTSWAMRLIYLQVSIVYFFTAVTKVDTHWLNGWALNHIISVPYIREAFQTVNEVFGWSALGMYALTAHITMLWQFFVAIAFLFPRLRPLACITGPLFHILVEVIGLKIGWFSYYMIAIYYILLFPNTWFLAISRPFGALLRPARKLFDCLVAPGRAPNALFALLAAAVAGGLAAALPYPGATTVAAVIATLTTAALWPRPRGPATSQVVRAAGHGLLAALMLVAVHSADVPYDYYRFWAGDLQRRGELVEAAERYEQANAHRAGRPARHFKLGELYLRLGRPDMAVRTFERGLELEPDSQRGHKGLAKATSSAPQAR